MGGFYRGLPHRCQLGQQRRRPLLDHGDFHVRLLSPSCYRRRRSFPLFPHGGVALGAVHQLLRPGLEGHPGGFAAGGAHPFVPLFLRLFWLLGFRWLFRFLRGGPPLPAAAFAALRWMAEALPRVKGLFPRGEGKFLPALFAGQCLILVHTLASLVEPLQFFPGPV